MKFTIKTLLLIIFFGFNSNIYCQNSTVAELNIPNHSPHSPEVANLAKYSEIPVNLYSGLPNIGIPIYTIKTQELDLQIGLSYHGGGNKVNDVASWVGLGWTLNAGGQIYRVVKQLPDDAKNAGFIYTDQLVENTTDLQTLKKIDSYHGNFNYGSQLMHAALRGMIDFAPDEFYYNLPGYSGKFYFTQYRTTDEPYGIVIDDENKGIKIKPNFNEVSKQILGFSITTPDGIIYSFGNSNDAQNCDYISNTTLISSNADNFRTINLSTSQNNREHITSWKMNSIRLKNGEHIWFQYEKQHFSNICEYNGEDRTLNTPDNTSGQESVTYGYGFSKSFTAISGFNSRLKKIIFRGGYIDFNESLIERIDVPYEKALDNISIYQSEFGVNKLYCKVVFDLNYFVSSPPNFPLMGCLSFFDNDILTHRLRLNKVTFLNNEEDDPIEYRLEYSDLNLPHKYSNSQDYWGYFNGKQNFDLIATMFVPEIPNVVAESFYERANREIDPDYTQANILKKIYYPEGGHTEFIFENNTRNPNLEIFGLENIFEPSILIDTLNLNTQAYNFINENGKRYVRRNLRIPDSIGYRGRLEFFTGGNVCINDPTGEFGPSLPLEDCDIRFHIKRNIINPGPNVTHPFGVPLGYSGATYIEPGDYVMEIEINSNETEISNLTENYAFAGVRYRENRFPDKKFIGGLRIKEILDFKYDQIYQQVENSHLIISNPDTIPTVKRSYIYKDNYNVDSGWIRGVPVFLTFDLVKISSVSIYNSPPIFSYGQRRKISSGNTLALMSSGSQYVGYTEVRELKQFYNEQEEYLVTASKFDYHPVFYSYLGAPVSFDWASGFEKEKTIFRLKDLSEFSSIQLANLDIMYLETRSRPLKSVISERYPIMSLNTSPVILGTDKFGFFTNGFDIYEKYFEPFGEVERPILRYDIKTGVPLVKRQTEIDFFYDSDNQQSQTER